MSPRSIAVQPTGHISSKLEGRLIPSKGGRGLFARERVRAGETLLVWGGDVVTGEELKWMSEEKHRLAVQIEENLYLVTPNEGPADWVNHSCDPNAGLIGQIVLVALRDIPRAKKSASTTRRATARPTTSSNAVAAAGRAATT